MSYYRSEPKPRVRKAPTIMIESYEHARRMFFECKDRSLGAPVGSYNGYYRVLMLPFDDRVYLTFNDWTGDPIQRRQRKTLAIIYPSDDVELTNAYTVGYHSDGMYPHCLGVGGNVLPIQTVRKGGDRLDHGIFIFSGRYITKSNGWGYNTAWRHSSGRMYRLQDGFMFNLRTRDVVKKITYEPPLGATYTPTYYDKTYESVRLKSDLTKNKDAWKEFLAKRRKAIKMIQILDKLETFNGDILPYAPLKGEALDTGHRRAYSSLSDSTILVAQCLALNEVFDSTVLVVIRKVGPERFIRGLKNPSVKLLAELNIYEGGK